MKMYPFSTKNHLHDIEFYKNYLFCALHDMEVGTVPMNETRYNKMHDMYYGELRELHNAMISSYEPNICYLTGPQIGLAKKIVVWANERRFNINHKH